MESNVLKIEILKDKDTGIVSAIPSSYQLGRMYDNNATKIEFIKPEWCNDLRLVLKFMSGTRYIGEDVIESDVTEYLVGATYTQQAALDMQISIVDSEDNIIANTNVLSFKLTDSVKPASQSAINKSILNSLLDKELISIVRVNNTLQIIQDDVIVGTINIPVNRVICVTDTMGKVTTSSSGRV